MQIIDGKKYNTKTAEQLAKNGWRGQGIYGTQLYVTKKGAFFYLHWSNMQGEIESIEPTDKVEAFNFYCKHWLMVFDTEAEFEAARLKYFKDVEVVDA